MNTLTTSQYQPRLSCVTNVDQPIRLQYSQIKLSLMNIIYHFIIKKKCNKQCHCRNTDYWADGAIWD